MKKLTIILQALYFNISLLVINDANASFIYNKLSDLHDSDNIQSEHFAIQENNENDN